MTKNIRVPVSTTEERIVELLKEGKTKIELAGPTFKADGETDQVLLVDQLEKPLQAFFERLLDPDSKPVRKKRKSKVKSDTGSDEATTSNHSTSNDGSASSGSDQAPAETAAEPPSVADEAPPKRRRRKRKPVEPPPEVPDAANDDDDDDDDDDDGWMPPVEDDDDEAKPPPIPSGDIDPSEIDLTDLPDINI